MDKQKTNTNTKFKIALYAICSAKKNHKQTEKENRAQKKWQ